LTPADFTGESDQDVEMRRLLRVLGAPHPEAVADLDQRSMIGPRTSAPRYNTSVIRRLLTEALSEEELTALVYDRFPAVFDQLSSRLSKGQRVQRLIEYVQRNNAVEDLLDSVAQANPRQYRRFADQLRPIER